MVALFVFTIGALAVTAMCLMSIQGNSLANRMTQANLLAQGKIEELLAVNDVLALDALAAAALPENVTNIDGNAVKFTRTWALANNIPADDTRWVTVTVSWADSKGNHQVELKSLAREN